MWEGGEVKKELLTSRVLLQPLGYWDGSIIYLTLPEWKKVPAPEPDKEVQSV